MLCWFFDTMISTLLTVWMKIVQNLASGKKLMTSHIYYHRAGYIVIRKSFGMFGAMTASSPWATCDAIFGEIQPPLGCFLNTWFPTPLSILFEFKFGRLPIWAKQTIFLKKRTSNSHLLTLEGAGSCDLLMRHLSLSSHPQLPDIPLDICTTWPDFFLALALPLYTTTRPDGKSVQMN